MDKKSLIGLGLIAGILGIWLYFSGPSKEQIARNKHIKDSIATAQIKAAEEEAKKAREEEVRIRREQLCRELDQEVERIRAYILYGSSHSVAANDSGKR